MTRDLRQFLFEHCFAAVWARPGLERSTRSIITISVLAAAGRIEELKAHIRMGLNNGLTRDQLKELFLHVGVYAYRSEALERYAATPVTDLETLEGLEQLRFLVAGVPVAVVDVATPPFALRELNNPEDVAPIEQALVEAGLE